MSKAKEEVRKMLDQIPDDASFEDIQYHIYVCQKIERGLKDIEEGRVLTQEEVERRMSRWLARHISKDSPHYAAAFVGTLGTGRATDALTLH